MFIGYYEELSETDFYELKNCSRDELFNRLNPDGVLAAYEDAVRIVEADEISCATCKYGGKDNACALCSMRCGSRILQWEPK